MQAAQEVPPKVRTILIVEDHEPLLRRWARGLEQDGRRVLTATTGDAALEHVRKNRPDVVFVDLFLAKENGVEVIRRLKELDPFLYTVLISAHLSVAYALAALRAGADDVMFKPLSFKQTLTRIEQGLPLEEDPDNPTLEQIEWEHISRVLLDCEGNITHAAERLGIYRQTLQRKLRKYMPRG